MDYSTISNKTNCTEIEEFTNTSELSERYYLLKKQHENLTSSFESVKQELHDTKRSYQTALDVQHHLAAELENHQSEVERRKNEANHKVTSLQEEISRLKEEYAEMIDKNANDVKLLQSEISRYKEELSLKSSEVVEPVRDNSEIDEYKQVAADAVSDARQAKQALEEAKLEINSWKARVEALNKDLEQTKEIAEARKEELKSANERESLALIDLAEVKAMLHQCTEPQDAEPHAAKGNSLFAEVEDKRQEMAKTLIQMKQTNSKLRRDLANKQAEVDTLLHEKQTIWEQQLGAAAHYDRELLESYEERISQLEGLSERQRREMARWFSKLSESTANGWLSGVLEHLKSECEKLRAEVLSRGAAQLASAALIRELRRKLAAQTANVKMPKQPSIEKEDRPVFRSIDENTKPPQIRNSDDVRKKVTFN